MKLVLATRNAHKLREFAALLAPHEIVALPADVVAAARDRRDVRRQRAGEGARRRRARPGCRRSPTTRASRPPRSAARPACARRATPASTRPTRRTSPSCCARRPPARRWPTSARWPTSPPRAPSTSSRVAARGRSPRSARHGRLRLRPGLPARRPRRRPHDGRARAGREGRDQPPRPRGARAARAARRLVVDRRRPPHREPRAPITARRRARTRGVAARPRALAVAEPRLRSRVRAARRRQPGLAVERSRMTP